MAGATVRRAARAGSPPARVGREHPEPAAPAPGAKFGPVTAVIVDSRHEPPRLARGAIERARLLARLAGARHAACVVVQGPAGCGKTTLALQWRAQALGYGHDVAWLTVAPGDDTEPLLDNLFASLDRVDPAIAREAAFLYNRDGDSRAAEPMAIALLHGLARHPRDIVLLVDDYHLVADARVHHLVQMLLDLAPPHVHVALLTRTAPPLSLARLRDQGALLELDYRDLRFNFSEAEALLRAQHAGLAKRDARILYDLTDGWVAGLRLVSMTLRRDGGAAPKARDPVQNAREFGAYFHREVLARLSAADVEAMTRLAAPLRFCEPLAVGLFGAEAGQALLARLRRDNLFLLPEAAAGGEAWFRFHPLFRDLLQQRFDAWPAADRQRTHSALGAWFGRRRLLHEAVHHCVAAGEVEQAADWLEQHAQSLFLQGDLRRLVRAVAELPRTALHSRPSLRLWVAWSQLCYRQLGACRQTLEALQATVSPDDADGRHHLTLLEGSLAIQEDDTEAAERLGPALAAMAPARDAILAGGRRNILGWLHAQRLQFDAARERLGGARQLLASGQPLLDSAFGALVGDGLLGLAHFRAGDMRQAERALRETLREAESALGPYCEGAVNAAAFLAPVLYEANELDALRALLEPRMDLIERVGLPDAVVHAGIARCRLHRLEGSLQEALAEVERLEELAQRRKLDRLLACALAERMAVHLAAHEAEAAEEALVQLRAIARRQAARGSAAALDVGWRAASARARWLEAAGRHAEALDTLESLLGARGFGAQQRLRAQVVARIGLLHRRLQRPGPARERVAEAWRAAQRLGLARSLLDLGDEVLEAGAQAVEAGALDAPARFHFERVCAQAQAARARPAVAAAPAREPLSERELAIVRGLAAALPNKRIGQALGISPETVKWHLKNVYAKLGVYGRDGAVARARELGCLEGAAP